jgi:hypothetical protein
MAAKPCSSGHDPSALRLAFDQSFLPT